MQRITGMAFVAALGLIPAWAQAGFVENWTAPGNANWSLFQAGGGDNGDVPLAWQSSGGAGGNLPSDGYVRSDMGETTTWSPTGPGKYYVAYTYDAFHHIDLTTDHYLSVALRDDGGANLHGGDLYFWIGMVVDPGSPGGGDEELSFYYADQPLTYGASGWVFNSLDLAQLTWVAFVPTPHKPVENLLNGPQQWGFGVFGAEADPDGNLGVDSLRIQDQAIPSPAPLALVLGGLAGLGLTRRRT